VQTRRDEPSCARKELLWSTQITAFDSDEFRALRKLTDSENAPQSPWMRKNFNCAPFLAEPSEGRSVSQGDATKTVCEFGGDSPKSDRFSQNYSL
jgi:hypothetical protein